MLHPRLEVIRIRYVQDTPKKRFGKNKEKKAIERHPIITTNADYDYILDEIDRHETLSLKGMCVLGI